MRGKTLKLLRKYGAGVGAGPDVVKIWWARLTRSERAVMAERIRREMERAEKEGGARVQL